MSNLNDKDLEWKRISRRSLRATAKIKTGELEGFKSLVFCFFIILAALWLIYVVPHISEAARSFYSSHSLLLIADSTNDFAQLAVGVSFVPVLAVSVAIAGVVQFVIDKITEPSRDRDRRNAQNRAG
ncbi:hypothetical protein KF707_16520 [Candidatus Obscuribacterales bacterium]|nr:hypothetical protein [Candidatus Obscuribacterales bacterium]